MNLRAAGRNLIEVLAPGVLGLVVIVAAWGTLVKLTGIAPYILPGPAQVAAAASEHLPEILQATAVTASLAACALVLSTVVGVAVAAVFSASPLVRATCLPYASLLQTVPIISVASFLIHVFNYGDSAVVATAFLISLFPVIAATTAGMTSADRRLHDLFELYRASKWQTLVKLQLPNSVPQIVSGVKIASGLSVIGAIVGEYLMGQSTRNGLGYLILKSFVWNTDYMFALTVACVMLGWAFFRMIELFERLFLGRWCGRGGEQSA